MSEIKRRTDLEALPVKLPDYIGTEILPWFSRDTSAGSFYYYDLTSDFNAQSGRDTAAVGDITTGETLAAHLMAFECVEKRARTRMGYNQIKGYKSEANADIAMGKKAKRAWYNAHEQAVANLLLKNAATDVIADPVTGIDIAVAELIDMALGPVALCLSRQNFVKLKKNQTVSDRLKNTGIGINAGGDPRKITAEQLALVFGVDKVLVGPDKQWYTGVGGTYNGNAAICILPDPNADPEEEPQFGRSVFFAYDSDATHFVMESFHDNLTDANYVDAKGLYVLKTLNSELAKTLQIFAAGEDESSSSESSSSD